MSVSCKCRILSGRASGWSLVQRSPTGCGVSECDREASIMRRPWPTRGCHAMERKKITLRHIEILFSHWNRRITTGWTVRGSNPMGGRDFSHPVLTSPGAHPAYCTMRTGPLSRGQAAGAWRWPPTPSGAEVKERVELYLYSPSGPSWPVLGWTLHLSCHKGSL
jgi:hypothetical protein